MSEPLSDAELAQLRDALPIVVPSAMEVSLVMTADRWMAIARLVDEVEELRANVRHVAGCPDVYSIEPRRCGCWTKLRR